MTGLVAQEYRRVGLDAVRPHPDNPRRGDVAAISESIGADGFYGAIVVQSSTGFVLAGNHRLLAAREQGLSELPAIFVDVDDVLAKRILLVDNRSADLAGWDVQQLAAVLQELTLTPAQLAGTGFAAADLAKLGGRPLPVDVDRVLEPPAVPVTVLGDVWELGPHRLVCGDCTDLDVIKRVGDADLLLTDPPYCSGGFQEAGRSAGSVGTDAPHKQIANDRLSTRGYMALLKAAVGRAGVPFVYVFTDWRMWVNLFDAVESSGYGVRNMIVWDKGTPGMGRGWRSQHEIIMWATKASQPNSKHDSAHGNVVQSKRTGNPLHTTQKPVDLIEQLLRVAHFAATVYDPFAGSGSTLIACQAMGRVARLVELDPAYCDVIVRRWCEFTGEKALRNGEPHDLGGAVLAQVAGDG